MYIEADTMEFIKQEAAANNRKYRNFFFENIKEMFMWILLAHVTYTSYSPLGS